MKALICEGAYFLPRLSTQASPLSPGTILYGTRSMSLLTIGSCMRRPISRLIAENLSPGLATPCRFAPGPTSRSPESVNATIEGVVRPPSAFSMTFAFLPSITATHEFVVPRSMPITLLMYTSFSEAGPVGPGRHRPDPPETAAATGRPRGLYMRRRRPLQPAQRIVRRCFRAAPAPIPEPYGVIVSASYRTDIPAFYA